MALFYALNFIASLIAFSGVTCAIFSKHISDGFLVKNCLSALAIGFAANAAQPSLHSLLWIMLSFASLTASVAYRFWRSRHSKQPALLPF